MRGALDHRRRKRLRHSLVGAGIFLAFGLVLIVVRILRVAGLVRVGAAHGETTLSFVLAVPLTVLFSLLAGAPVGFAISRWRLGTVAGGLLGAALFSVGLAVLIAPVHPMMALILSPFFGFLVGALISVHVRADAD